MSLDAHLWVAQIAAPRTDPAFDRSDREAWLTLAKRYAQTRSPADLAALAVKGKSGRPRKAANETANHVETGKANGDE
jgi:hypothetical protein